MMHIFRKWFFLPIFAVTALSAFCAETPSAQELLRRARDPKSASTYGRFFGTLQHRRRGQETLEMPLYFGVIIQPERTIGQILVNYRESYMISQNRLAGREGTSVIYDHATCKTLNLVGLRASDLTMSFLHYKLVKELDGAMLNAVVSCRVLLLESPDDNPGGKEYVRVFLEKENAFPLRAEFLKRPDEQKPFRMIEANGFTKKNDLYYARTITVQGPGWRTKVEFEPSQATLGMFDKNNPVNIFLPVIK